MESDGPDRDQASPANRPSSSTTQDTINLLKDLLGRHNPVCLEMPTSTREVVIARRLALIAYTDMIVSPRRASGVTDGVAQFDANDLVQWITSRFELRTRSVLQRLHDFGNGLDHEVDALIGTWLCVAVSKRTSFVSHDMAHDVAQQLFLKRAGHIRRDYDPTQGGLGSYLFARARTHWLSAEEQRECGIDKRRVTVADLPDSGSISFEDETLRQINHDEMIARARPSDDSRLQHLGDFPIEEIADRQGKSVAATNSDLYRDRMKSRERLEAWGYRPTDI